MSFYHLKAYCLKIWLLKQFFLLFDLKWPKVDILVENSKKLDFFSISGKNRSLFLFLINFFGLSIKFFYSRPKNLRLLMSFFMKNSAGRNDIQLCLVMSCLITSCAPLTYIRKSNSKGQLVSNTHSYNQHYKTLLLISNRSCMYV